MNVICVDESRLALAGLRRRTQRIVPKACVYTCRSPDKAVELAEEYGCDVLITGVDMGAYGREGIRLAEKVKQMNPRVNIIFVTVCEERDCAKDFFRLRASGFIRKPYEARELAEEFANLRYAAV